MDTLICLDIDGTITSDKFSVPVEVQKFLKELSQKGYIIFLETGRTFTFAMKALSQLDFPFYIAAQNGSIVLEMPNKKEFFRKYLDQSVLPEVEKAFSELGLDFLIYSGFEKGDFCYFRKKNLSLEHLAYLKDLQDREHTVGNNVKNYDLIATFPLIKGFGSREAMESLKQNLLKKNLFQVSLNKDPFNKKFHLLLVTHKQVSKGYALEALKKKFGIKRVIVAGDDDNDNSMLEVADVKIVINSASEDLLKMADIIALGPKDLGIIPALKEALNW